MAEYIKREDAYTTLTDYYNHSTETQHMALKEALDRVPAAEVVPTDFHDRCMQIEIAKRFDLEKTKRKTGKWIPVTKDTPSDFVSVQAHMTDAGQFPSVREAYTVDGLWFFPALKEFHPVDAWKRFDEPPKEKT